MSEAHEGSVEDVGRWDDLEELDCDWHDCEWHGCENGCGDAGIPCRCMPHCVHCGWPMTRDIGDDDE